MRPTSSGMSGAGTGRPRPKPWGSEALHVSEQQQRLVALGHHVEPKRASQLYDLGFFAEPPI